MSTGETTVLLSGRTDENAKSPTLPGWAKLLPLVMAIVGATCEAEVLQDVLRGSSTNKPYNKPISICWLNHCFLAILAFAPRYGAPCTQLMKDGTISALLLLMPAVCWLVSTRYIPVSIATPIWTSAFLYVVPMAYFMFGNIPSRTQICAIAVSMAGLSCYYFGTNVHHKSENLLIGCIAASAYSFLFAIYMVAVRYIVKSRPYPYYIVSVTGWTGIMNFFLFPSLLIPHFLGIEHLELPDASVAASVTLQAMLSSIGNIGNAFSVAICGPTLLAISSTTLIPFASIVDFYVRHVLPTKYDIIGGVLLCISIIMWEYGREGIHDVPELGKFEGDVVEKEEFDPEAAASPSRDF